MSAEMTADNPYNAPAAELNSTSDELYSPNIFSFNGRIGRLRYLAYGVGTMFVLMLALIPLIGASALMGGETGASIGSLIGMLVVYAAMIVLSVMFGKRRLNDLGRSGWWFLLSIVPIANLVLTVYLMFFPGTDGSNEFGPAPGPNSIGVLILGWRRPGLCILGFVAALLIPQLAGDAPPA